MATDSFPDYEKRPARNANRDGIAEMCIGLLFIAMPLITYFFNAASATSIWHSRYTVLVAFVILLVMYQSTYKLLKQKITYRRTGYVKHRYSKWKTALGTVIGFAVAAAVPIALYRSHVRPREATMIAISGFMWAALYACFFIYLAKMHQLWRWGVVAAMAVGPLGVYSIFRDVGDISTLSATVLGACWLVSGLIAFCSYLRRTQPATAESVDGPQ